MICIFLIIKINFVLAEKTLVLVVVVSILKIVVDNKKVEIWVMSQIQSNLNLKVIFKSLK